MKDSLENKQKALDNAISQIEKAFGKGAIMKLKQNPVEKIDTISTGSIALDAALGVGGLPKGRIIEIFGPESSGKTTLALHVIAEAQKKGGSCAFIDAEHALDVIYARKLGVNADDLIISQPDTGEQALHIVEYLVSSGAVDVIIIDSVAALTPRAEIEGDMGDQHMGLQARLLSHGLRKLTSITSKANCILIFINQIRMKIGVVYGNPETTTGGNALKFYASIRLDIRKVSAIKDKENVTGNETRVKVVKNKVAPPFREAKFDIMYNEGISKFGEIIDMGVKFGLIEKAGAYYSYNDIRLGQGKENVKSYLKTNKEITSEIEVKIRERLNNDGSSFIDGDYNTSLEDKEQTLGGGERETF
ncbi:MAG: recombinase RecA [Wolbachia endosymbiont of Fragariocoptes setiger]|nr:recombinase RecA [Wolbachia endosymbiont of Fragariocoptes setiger]